jgi:hypothetical protein
MHTVIDTEAFMQWLGQIKAQRAIKLSKELE